MATESLQSAASALPEEKRTTYLNVASSLASWLLTKDHKRIGILYLVPVTLMFCLGAAGASIVRLNLINPHNDMFSQDLYNRSFTLHGVVMVFLFLVPIVPGVLGNFFLPLMIGAKDMAFPRINLLSWYLYMLGIACIGFAALAGGVDTGWTFYPPFSTRSSLTNVSLTMVGIIIGGFSSILTGLNFVVTTHMLRAPGMTWFRLPIFVWTLYATSFLFLMAVPVLAMALLLSVITRLLGFGLFDPAMGGDPLLYQHLFWFYSHPAVYIMILPGMGVISEVIPCFARKSLFGYGFMAVATFGIAMLGFAVWGHHMFVAGMSLYAALIFSALSYLVAVPSAIKVFNWLGTLFRGSITFEAPMIYALSFVLLFTAGGITGLFLAALGIDAHVHATYFVVGHFHFIMVGGMVTAYMAGLHYWWPKITGRMYSDWWSRLAAIILLVGFFLTFLPFYILGINGMQRRIFHYAAEFQVWNVMATAGATILAVGYVMPLVYLIYSLFRGKPAPDNPWHATGLEWQTPSPPSPENFETTPVVVRKPYEYHSGKAQNES